MLIIIPTFTCNLHMSTYVIMLGRNSFEVYISSSIISNNGSSRFDLLLEYDDTFNVQPQPIQFLEEPTDHVTLAGADVTFVCSTTVLMSNDFSTPHTTWLYNNSIIESGHHYIISHNGNSTLTVKNVTSNDQGVYHCMADEWRISIRSRYGQLNGT